MKCVCVKCFENDEFENNKNNECENAEQLDPDPRKNISQYMFIAEYFEGVSHTKTTINDNKNNKNCLSITQIQLHFQLILLTQLTELRLQQLQETMV
ncbi:hypothetical protein Glove_177g74 [Diversispora epigaea]|uniref:Uncharacterized protein n=1 Tax=Diversispora epigaea TaxID=1348612 RepID=A0A397IT88_9GLOM|nr:hypothetical protein Glove_177g74 [Diversispora epigaea]